MNAKDFNINFDRVLDRLGDNSVLLLSMYENDIGVIEAVRNDTEVHRFYCSTPEEFRRTHENIITEVYFTYDENGEIVPTRQSILNERQKFLLELLKEYTTMKHNDNRVSITVWKIAAGMGFCIVSLCLFLSLLSVVYNVHSSQADPFAILDTEEVKNIKPAETYTAGKYRVEINGFSRYFDVTEIVGSEWKCKDGIALYVTDQLDIWKEGYLLIRTDNFSIEKVE